MDPLIMKVSIELYGGHMVDREPKTAQSGRYAVGDESICNGDFHYETVIGALFRHSRLEPGTATAAASAIDRARAARSGFARLEQAGIPVCRVRMTSRQLSD
jgi:hypothetical protein